MFEAEAATLCEILLGQENVSPLLNLGSSTGAFRRVTKPHIDARLFEPLRQAGVTIVHCDLKPGQGVDVSGDILDPAISGRLKASGFKCVLISNLLEHVRDRDAVVAACEEIVGPGGLILATVPSSFPYHADPMDTGYRPSPEELAGAFARSRVLLAEELIGETYADQLRARGIPAWREAARTLLWLLISFARPRSARARLHRWRWYRRPYRVSIVLVAVRRARFAAISAS
jgi:SAM-dependent methyltransferase